MKKLLLSAVALLMVVSSQWAFGQQTGEIKIDEAKLGKGVTDRQLENESAEFALNEKVFLWVKATGGPGEPLAVTWKNGDRTYKSSLAVGGSPWRTWCYKTAALPGNWIVIISDSKGTVLKELSFKVGS